MSNPSWLSSCDTSIINCALIAASQHPMILLLCILIALITYRVALAISDPLRGIPGPFLSRFSRVWLFHGFASRRWLRINQDLHRKYGAIVRIAPGQYSIDDAAANKIIYGHGSKFPKSDWYTPFNAKRDGLFGTRDMTFHAVLRRKLQGAYSMSALKAYEPYINDCVELYMKRLDELDGQTIDLMHWNHGFAFDAIGMITFSHRFGFLDTGRDDLGFMSAIPKNSRNNMLIGVYPFLFPRIHIILGLFYGQKVADTVRQYVLGQMVNAKRQIQEEKQRGVSDSEDTNEPLDFISKLIRLEQDPESGKGITDEEVALAAATNLGAGSDTTAITATAILYYIFKYRDVLQNLRQELKKAAATAGISSGALIPFSVSKRLPYLQAVIKEAVRVHPASGVPMPRVVPKGGTVLCGRFFPEGTVVGANAWVTHQNQTVWGSDAADFNPERWLTGKTPPEVQYLSWGQGSRVCIGRNIAEQQLYILIPALVMRYDFELTPDCKENLFTDSAVFARPDVFATLKKRF